MKLFAYFLLIIFLIANGYTQKRTMVFTDVTIDSLFVKIAKTTGNRGLRLTEIISTIKA